MITPTANSLKGTRVICNAADHISGQKSCPLFLHDFTRFSVAVHSVTANALFRIHALFTAVCDLLYYLLYMHLDPPDT